MTDGPTNEERDAMIAGDRAGALDPDEVADLELLRDVLANPSTWAEPSPALEDAVVRAVGEAEPTTSEVPHPHPTTSPDELSVRRRRVALSALAVAAAVVAIVVAVIVTTQGGSGPEYTAQLSATALAPGARADADVTRTDAGFRVALDASGLPPLRNGEYYQAWLKNAAGTLVPIGSFSSSDGAVILWSGVSPTSFPTITVTIEPADNDQTSSGRRVLVGEIRAQ